MPRIFAAVALVSVIACLPAPSRGQAKQQVLTPHQMMTLRQVSSAALSPDGQQIAYLLSVPRAANEPDGAARNHLYVVSFDGGKPRGLVVGKRSVGSIGWSRDGKHVTWLGRVDGDQHTRLYFQPVQGGSARALTPDQFSVRAYAFSADGARAAYTTTPPSSRREVRQRAAGFDQIVYEEGAPHVQLWVMDESGRKRTRIKTEGSVHEIAFAGTDHVVFTMAPTPAIDDRYMRRDLYRAEIASGEINRIVDVPGKFGAFAPSPGGGRIAYTAGRDIHDPKDSSLFVISAKGGWPVSLTPGNFQGHVDEVRWLDDDRLIVRATEGCHRTVYTQPAAGGNRDLVVVGGVAALQGLSLSRDGRRVTMVGSTRKHPNEVYAMDLGGRARRLTDSNPWLAATLLGAQRVVRYPAEDGLEIEGLLIKPVGYEAGKRYPLIVHAHGGPESCYVDGWTTRYSTPGQVAAGAGYLCFYPNYRSSTGRGVAFSKAGQGDAGGREFQDVIDGVDYLVKQGLADKDRVGITGGSYGGYFSAWAATKHSKRFAASVMFVGISNQVSKVGTTDIPQESYYSHWHVRPWENIHLFLERSPISYARQCETPILIMHGKDDPRVSSTQSVELYRWLKLKGDVPVRLVLYPKEGHGNRRRAHQLDYALRCMRWFDTFLVKKAKKVPPHEVDYRDRSGN